MTEIQQTFLVATIFFALVCVYLVFRLNRSRQRANMNRARALIFPDLVECSWVASAGISGKNRVYLKFKGEEPCPVAGPAQAQRAVHELSSKGIPVLDRRTEMKAST